MVPTPQILPVPRSRISTPQISCKLRTFGCSFQQQQTFVYDLMAKQRASILEMARVLQNMAKQRKRKIVLDELKTEQISSDHPTRTHSRIATCSFN